tara:strand:+ start:714 stop:1331 length:618 start_codon:yes stop_codon:yes gene_type:complete
MSKYSNIIAFGCCETNYDGKQKCWPEYLGDMLNAKVMNYAKNTVSNSHTVEFISKNYKELLRLKKNSLVIVSLIELNRLNVGKKSIRMYDSPNRMVDTYYSHIISIMSILDKIGIDYRIFSGFVPFSKKVFSSDEYARVMMYFAESSNYDVINNEKVIGLPFFTEINGINFEDWAFEKDESFRGVKDHPSEKAHIEWAKWLKEKI